MISKRNATLQDVLDAPEHLVAELIDGDLVLSPRPRGPHTAVASYLGAEILPPFVHGRGGPGGWRIYHEPELRIGRDVLVPDLAGWRAERLPEVPEFFTVTPDWVCEIASPSTEKFDRKRKLRRYAAMRVGHAWLVQPRLRMIEVLRLEGGRWTVIDTVSDDERVRIEPFDALELDLARLWYALPLRANDGDEDDEAA